MLLQLLDCLEKSKEILTRRSAILKVENTNKTHLPLIKGIIKVKYKLEESVTKRNLEEAQLAKLYNEIEKRKLDSKLYNVRKGELGSISASSRWLNKSKIMSHNESTEIFSGDHKVLIQCIHLLLLNRYKFKSSKQIRSHSVQEFLIMSDKNDVKIRLGITSQDSLQIVEIETLRKYNLLANELEIIPYVMTWDGIMTKYHRTNVKRLQILMNIEAYIQSIVHKKTVETISFDRRRGLESRPNAEQSWKRASLSVILGAEMHKQPTPHYRKQIQGMKEPTININKKSDLEEDNEVVKRAEKMIQK
ncbi:hypothetical protein CWI38_0272p0040 [Hamiltosporidium tvaerminnensis]|uniref:Uncharacterized protein n=1 Tax=Hamiltosporidium tvaerminnensis TaxID=1176355 RepID=A0A4V2JY27_9MICR|nr:hypothetical protein CWI38_0272p0040 [Hamiltosporidium tvaerminnensis]